MDFDNIFPFNPATDSYNCDLEILVRDSKERSALGEDYKRRFCNNKEGQRKYTAIIKKQQVYYKKPTEVKEPAASFAANFSQPPEDQPQQQQIQNPVERHFEQETPKGGFMTQTAKGPAEEPAAPTSAAAPPQKKKSLLKDTQLLSNLKNKFKAFPVPKPPVEKNEEEKSLNATVLSGRKSAKSNAAKSVKMDAASVRESHNQSMNRSMNKSLNKSVMSQKSDKKSVTPGGAPPDGIQEEDEAERASQATPPSNDQNSGQGANLKGMSAVGSSVVSGSMLESGSSSGSGSGSGSEESSSGSGSGSESGSSGSGSETGSEESSGSEGSSSLTPSSSEEPSSSQTESSGSGSGSSVTESQVSSSVQSSVNKSKLSKKKKQ